MPKEEKFCEFFATYCRSSQKTLLLRWGCVTTVKILMYFEQKNNCIRCNYLKLRKIKPQKTINSRSNVHTISSPSHVAANVKTISPTRTHYVRWRAVQKSGERVKSTREYLESSRGVRFELLSFGSARAVRILCCKRIEAEEEVRGKNLEPAGTGALHSR